MSRFAIIHFLSGSFFIRVMAKDLTASRDMILPSQSPMGGQVMRASQSKPEQLEWFTPSQGNTGGVTSVGLTSNPIFVVTGSPITNQGVINLDLSNVPEGNRFLGSPNQVSGGKPIFRRLVREDIPPLDASDIKTGKLDISILPTDGQNGLVKSDDPRLHNQNSDSGTSQNSFQLDRDKSGCKLVNEKGSLKVCDSTGKISDLYVKDLYTQGDITQINSTQLNIGDNIITLNSDVPKNQSPTENAGIEINRGNQPKAQLIWQESTQKWVVGFEGNKNYSSLPKIISGTFNQSDVINGILPVKHNLGKYVLWSMWNQDDKPVFPDCTAKDNTLEFDFNANVIDIGNSSWKYVISG